MGVSRQEPHPATKHQTAFLPTPKPRFSPISSRRGLIFCVFLNPVTLTGLVCVVQWWPQAAMGHCFAIRPSPSEGNTPHGDVFYLHSLSRCTQPSDILHASLQGPLKLQPLPLSALCSSVCFPLSGETASERLPSSSFRGPAELQKPISLSRVCLPVRVTLPSPQPLSLIHI